MECIHCKKQFNHQHPRHKAIGRINECGDCAEDIPKTKGIIDGHGKSDVRVIIQRDPKKDIGKEMDMEVWK